MIVRILIDGYNLLHAWKHLAAGAARYSEEARNELIKAVTSYCDSSLTPVTIVFDGRSPGTQPERDPSSLSELEILYTPSRQSADQIIERAAILYAKYGQVMAVTNDSAIRDLVIGSGGTVCSCDNFLTILQKSCHEMQLRLKYSNQSTNNRFKR